MIFNTLQFALFFIAVLALYHALRHRAQNWMLLLASYFFYACWDWRFVSIILGSTALDYWVGWLLDREKNELKRKWILTASLVANLGLLGFFKYFNFFSESFQNLMGVLGWQVNPVSLNVILPVGISFYTFQSMSYTLDIYRREMLPTKSFLDFALSVAFFPHMVAGPIQRARSLIDQVEHPRKVSRSQVAEGLHLILWGLVKKSVIADNLAVGVDKLFQSGGPYDGLQVWLGVLAFALQIYGDFSGYSDMARGTAKLMGFELMLNFNLPYFAKNPQDYWHRWHISLSTWLRDYLYFSLGGSRRGTGRTYVNLFLTMLLGGLWHGASWTFVLWGAYHGALLCIHRALSPRIGSLFADSLGWRFFSTVVMFVCTLYGWLIFRAVDMEQLISMTCAMFHLSHTEGLVRGLAKIMFYAWPLVLVQCLQFWKGDLQVLLRLPLALQAGVSLIFLYLVIILGSFDGQSFIYFQF